MKKDAKEQYVGLLENNARLLDTIVETMGPHADKTGDPAERTVLCKLEAAAALVRETAVYAANIKEDDNS